MRFAILGVVVAGLTSVAHAGLEDQVPPEAYTDPIDQQIARTGVGVPGRPYPCAYEEVSLGMKVIASKPTEVCYKMMAPQRYRGLWRNDFEGSQFCPEPAKECTFDSPGERIWLGDTPGKPAGGLYEVEFIGRRTKYKGSYGHMGVSDHWLTVDRLISLKELQAPPPPPTKAEIIAQMKKCEAEKTCFPNWEAINKMDEE